MYNEMIDILQWIEVFKMEFGVNLV